MLREAHQLHESLHIGAKALVRKCGISIANARHVVATCPYCQKSWLCPAASTLGAPEPVKYGKLWQLCQLLKPRAWLAITVDAYSVIIVATQHQGTDSRATVQHWLTAMAWLGIPKQIKTDNGPSFILRSIQAFTLRWNITLVCSIPHKARDRPLSNRLTRL